MFLPVERNRHIAALALLSLCLAVSYIYQMYFGKYTGILAVLHPERPKTAVWLDSLKVDFLAHVILRSAVRPVVSWLWQYHNLALTGLPYLSLCLGLCIHKIASVLKNICADLEGPQAILL